MDWDRKATAIQTVMWRDGDGRLATAELPAEGPVPMCHLLAHDFHADVSSSTVEIYSRSAGLSQGMRLSYVSEELGISFPMPIVIGVDNTTAIAYANRTVK